MRPIAAKISEPVSRRNAGKFSATGGLDRNGLFFAIMLFTTGNRECG
jgi:hypothetical protein